MNLKIAHFGIARFFKGNGVEENTNTVGRNILSSTYSICYFHIQIISSYSKSSNATRRIFIACG